jgi:hypothetical protein
MRFNVLICKKLVEMGSILPDMATTSVSIDEFQALEQRVLRAVDIVKRERKARLAAEAEAQALREQLDSQMRAAMRQIEAAQSQSEAAHIQNQAAQMQIVAMAQERDAVRERIEKMLEHMDDML